MPELPEVQTVVNNLKNKLIGRTIISIESPNGYVNVFHKLTIKDFNNYITTKKITNIRRIGKYIVIGLNNGFISIHLRMTGKLLFNKDYKKKHISAKFLFEKNNCLIFDDVRKFGRIYYSENLNWLNKKIGIDPLSDNFSPELLYTMMSTRKRMIKSLLFDQSFIAGLGNIYIDESLWKSKIHPLTISSRLSVNDIKKLHNAIVNILKKAIKFQGTSIINFYFDKNTKGNYGEKLYVYGRNNMNCLRCNGIITKIVVSQRGTHICNNCQKQQKEQTNVNIKG